MKKTQLLLKKKQYIFRDDLQAIEIINSSDVNYLNYLILEGLILFLTNEVSDLTRNYKFSNLILNNMEAQLNNAFYLVSQPKTESIKQGEQLLTHLKKDNGYPLALLHYLNNSNIHDQGKLRAAIELRLWCQYYKDLEEFERNYYNQFIESIKESLLFAYLNFPLKISKTLRPGIICLTEILFPSQWESLIPTLLNYVIQNSNSTAAVLKLIQNISHKYTYMTRSDPLYQEIIYMCETVHDFIINLTTSLLERVMANPNNVADVQLLELLMKIFYNLNYQDLHAKFQDNLQKWMQILKAIMNLGNINSNVFECKGAALDAILLYASKYKEDVQEPIKGFCQEIWHLCSGASQDTEYDQIVFNCLKFFKSLVMWPQMKSFFNQNMDSLIQNLILPNIGFTKTAISLFEEQIDVYIDYYFRNTQIQTRRAAALELLRVICRHYTAFEPFLRNQLGNFQKIEGKNIKAECTILSLAIDGCSKGFRDVDGCTQLFVNQQLIDFCYQHIAKQSLSQMYCWINNNPNVFIEKHYNVMHVATIIRFLFYFRIFFPVQELSSILQFLASIHTDSDSLRKVIYLSINGFLIMKHGDFILYRNLVPFFNSKTLRPIALDIFKVIYQGTKSGDFLLQSLTKMFFNVSKALGQSNGQFFNYQIEIAKQMLSRTGQYDFNSVQFLFQTLGLLAYWYIRTGSQNKQALEEQILKFFKLSLDSKSDLLNFCLQILAIFLQLQPNTNDQYNIIYQALLLPQNWKEQNQSIMSSYVQFIIAYIAKHKQKLLDDRQAIEVILSKIVQIDHVQLFYRFLEAVMLHTTLDEFYNTGYLSIVVKGGQALATSSIQGRKASLLFICKLMTVYNTNDVLNYLNNCCPQYFDQLLEVSADILKTISVRVDRKYIFISICNSISCNYFKNIHLLGQIVNNLICNTVDRFSMRNISSVVQQNQKKEKKESTYKKLQIFKQFQKQEPELNIDEEQYFVRTFKQLIHNAPEFLNEIESKNRDRMMRLSDKYNK